MFDKFLVYIGDRLFDNSISVKNITNKIPPELYEIYDICRNEIAISNSEQIKKFYTDVYFKTLMEYHKLVQYEKYSTMANAIKFLNKSKSCSEATLRFFELSDKHHELSISLRDKRFRKMKFKHSTDDDVVNIIRNIVFSEMTHIKNDAKNIYTKKQIIFI